MYNQTLQSPKSAKKISQRSRRYFSSIIVVVFLLLNSLMSVAGSTDGYGYYTNVKVYLPKDLSQRIDLLALLEVDHLDEHDGAFNYTVDIEQLKLLKASGYKYEVINEDAVAYLAEENQKYYDAIKKNPTARVAFERSGDLVDSIIKRPADFVVQSTLGGYYRYGQMDTAMRTLETKYPALVQRFSIGNSTEGRAIWCVKISDNPTADENEPEILFMGHHHAREAIGGSSMIFLMQYLCEYYSKDSRIKDLVDNREIFIIVCSNPDGWEYNRKLTPTGGAQHRKNMRNNPGTLPVASKDNNGVDLNRNWGVNWANCTGATTNCGTNSTTNDTYWGPTQYSEPETRALRLFCRAHDFGAVMDQHSVGPYYSLPWGRLPPYGVTMSALDDDVYTQMAAVMGKYNGMRYGSTVQTLGYEVSGGMKDVLLKGDDSLPNGRCYGMTGEGSNGTSSTSFWPVAADIVKLCKGMVYQDIQLIYTVGSYVDLQDRGNINIQAKSGKFHFRVRRIGLGTDTVRVSIVPLQNIYNVGKTISNPIKIAPTSLPNFNSVYDDSISYVLASAIGSGNSVRFAWRIETGGYTYYDTITNIYQANSLFDDNMEGTSAATKWTISGGGWAYSTDAPYNGTKSFAESPAANYTDNIQRIAQSSTNLNLTGAGAAYLSFWVRYRAENFRDILRVEVSTNGTTWVAISGKNTVREPGSADGSMVRDSNAITGINEFWTREVFDLKNYLGASALRFRFRFRSDAGSATYVYDNDWGFNIDDVSVITGGTPTTLPVELVDFTGHNDGAVNILNWNTASELNTKSFIIQRSTNAVDYEDIGTVAAAGNSRIPLFYTFTDENPYNGENIYRLKMVDLDNSYKNSKLVSINVQNENGSLTPTGIDKIYPNPTNGTLSVNFYVNEEQSDFDLKVFNVFGQMMNNESMNLSKGQHTIDLNATDFANGQYFLSITDNHKGISYETKFIKL